MVLVDKTVQLACGVIGTSVSAIDERSMATARVKKHSLGVSSLFRPPIGSRQGAGLVMQLPCEEGEGSVVARQSDEKNQEGN